MSSIAGAIRDEILDGEFPIGSRLPSELDLAARHGVSRSAVRTALASLARAGLVESRRGAGWFVQPGQIQGLDSMRSFTQWAHSRGRRAGGRILSREHRRATAREARLLGIGTGADVLFVVRVRLLEERAVMIERSTWAPWVVPHIVQVPDDLVSTTGVLEAAGISVTSGTHRIEAVAATTQDAQLLGVRRSSPLLQVRRETFASDGRPVECAEDRYVPHTISFEAHAFGSARAIDGAR